METNIYIFIDDSGVFHKNETKSFFGGIVFTSESDYKVFIKKYNKFMFKYKIKYMGKEVKNYICNNIEKDKIIKFLNQYITFGLYIKIYNVCDDILNTKSSRGRFKEYALRRVIKDIFIYLKSNKLINEEKINLFITIDNDNLKSGVNRLLTDDIYKELKIGFINSKYNLKFKSVIKNELTVSIKYVDSKKDVGVQASDFIAGYVRKQIINNKKLKDINITRTLP